MTDQERYELIEAKRRCKELERESITLRNDITRSNHLVSAYQEELDRREKSITELHKALEQKDDQIDKLNEYTEKVVSYLVACSLEDRELFAARFGIVPIRKPSAEEK